jgi:hypothetical protein
MFEKWSVSGRRTLHRETSVSQLSDDKYRELLWTFSPSLAFYETHAAYVEETSYDVNFCVKIKLVVYLGSLIC